MCEKLKAMKSVLPEYQFEDMSKIRGKPIMPGRFNDSNEYDVFIGVSRLVCSTPVLQCLITHFNGHLYQLWVVLLAPKYEGWVHFSHPFSKCANILLHGRSKLKIYMLRIFRIWVLISHLYISQYFLRVNIQSCLVLLKYCHFTHHKNLSQTKGLKEQGTRRI